jgi:hypothetical protein
MEIQTVIGLVQLQFLDSKKIIGNYVLEHHVKKHLTAKKYNVKTIRDFLMICR